MWLGRTRRVHFVGIGGIGMSGIAEVLANLGYDVSGSDMRTSDITERLGSLGAQIRVGHDAAHVVGADVVVTSSAVAADNPEVVAARQAHVPVVPRAEMLAELMRLRVGIAVAGAHGKTTTTSMIALMLERAGLDPTAVIGGRLSAFGSNARLGRGQYIVVEADESDRSFLKLSPAFAVITNIDREHMEAYGTFDRVIEAFRDFADRVPFYGAVVACADDRAVEGLIGRLSRRVVRYGFAADADILGFDPHSDGHRASCGVRYRGFGPSGGVGEGVIELGVPGLHNLQNALAAVGIGLELGVPFARIAGALAEFRGAERRYQLKGTAGGVRVIDDYGHHPTEIAAVLRAARDARPRQIVAVFQPHRYTRTRDLLEDFGPALALADVVVLTDIYAAGEPPIPGVSLETLADAIRPSVSRLLVARDLAAVPPIVAEVVGAGDIVITFGAGSITQSGDQILLELRHREVTP
jgi:UDP-N-acetylmuramate--alanine ligase